MNYRSKPVEVQAVQITDGKSYRDALLLFGDYLLRCTVHSGPEFKIKLKNYKVMHAREGDWIIKDGDTFSVCSDEEFRRKYEEIGG